MGNVWIWVVVAAMLVSGYEAADFDIKKYNPKADGKSDDTTAFVNAWKDVCNAPDASKFIIPKGSYMVRSLRFEGPCKAPSIIIQATGAEFVAPADPAQVPKPGWVLFDSLDNIHVYGGLFDGKGETTWKKGSDWNSADCIKTKKCNVLPISLSFNNFNNSVIQDLTSKDSKNFHFNCIGGHNVTFKQIKIVAPGDSPNTDGLHIARSTNIRVLDTDIQTGDDCISLGDDLDQVQIKNVKCGPGHGISIGSLGKYNNEKDVKGIYVEWCTFTNTMNGVRIKTWPSSPATIKVSDIRFVDLTMNNVSNPIIFDQQYCPWNVCSKEKASLIQLSDIKIANVKGTSATQDVMVFSCSSSKPCTDIHIGNVDLRFNGDKSLGGPTMKCENIKYTSIGVQNPPLCAKAAAPKVAPKRM